KPQIALSVSSKKLGFFGVIGRLSSVSFANFCCSFFSSIPPDLATQAASGTWLSGYCFCLLLHTFGWL
ncbi:hypothetical protein BHE74_00019094, partial [Ensete ventricosum]